MRQLNNHQRKTIVLAVVALFLVVMVTVIAITSQQFGDVSVYGEGCQPGQGVCADLKNQGFPVEPFCCTCDASVGGNRCLPTGWGNCTEYCNSLTPPPSSSSGTKPPPNCTKQICTPNANVNMGCGANGCPANTKRFCRCAADGCSYTSCQCVESKACTGGGFEGDTCTTTALDCQTGLVCCSCGKCAGTTGCDQVCNPTPPPTSSSSSSGGGNPITCAPPNKVRGDQCNPLCANNSSCDFDDPLECRVCTMNATDAARGCRFEKEGLNICMLGAIDSGACGAVVGCTFCNSPTDKPLDCDCTGNYECNSGYCDQLAGTCQPNPNPPVDPCTYDVGRPTACPCDADRQCATNYCDKEAVPISCRYNRFTGCTGKYNVYRCYRDTAGTGCQDNVLAVDVDYQTASGLVNSTPACAVTQADCIGTSGGEGALTVNNWTTSCEPTTSSGTTPPPSSSGDTTSSGTTPPPSSSGDTTSSGTPPPTSSGTTPPPVVEQCNYMQRTPDTNPTLPNAVFNFTVSYDSTSQLSNTRLYMIDHLGQEHATVAPSSITNPGGSTFEYTYALTVPASSANGNYTFRFSKSGSLSDLDITPSCMQSIEVYTPPIAESCIYLTRNPNNAQVQPGTNFSVQVRYKAGQIYQSSRVYLTGPASTVISSAAYPTGPFPTDEYNYDFTLQLPTDAQNGDYQLRFSPSGLGNDLVQSPTACTNSLTVYSPVVVNRCINMDRTPAELTLPPSTTLSVVVTDETQIAYPGSGLFLLDNQDNLISSASNPAYTSLGNNQHQYTFSINIPSGSDNGNYFFRYSRTNNVNDLVTNTECTDSVTIETPPPPFVNQCI